MCRSERRYGELSYLVFPLRSTPNTHHDSDPINSVNECSQGGASSHYACLQEITLHTCYHPCGMRDLSLAENRQPRLRI